LFVASQGFFDESWKLKPARPGSWDPGPTSVGVFTYCRRGLETAPL